MREALRQWESLGIITRNKGGGTRIVAEVSTRSVHLPLTVQIEADSLQRMLAVRRPLEIEAVRIATRVADDAARRRIMLRMLELMEVYEAGEDWRPADRLFHAAIHDATGNPLFAKVIHQIHRAFHDLYDAPVRPAATRRLDHPHAPPAGRGHRGGRRGARRRHHLRHPVRRGRRRHPDRPRTSCRMTTPTTSPRG